MKYLHQNKIIHRDLNPKNILLNEYYYPKIADFGISKKIDDDQIIKQLNKANFIIKDKQSLLKTLIIYDFRQNEKNKTYNGNRYCQKTYKFCHPLNSISKKLL